MYHHVDLSFNSPINYDVAILEIIFQQSCNKWLLQPAEVRHFSDTDFHIKTSNK